jgi:hypothetical protein
MFGNLVHIHIPKTGGTWVRIVLQKRGRKAKDLAGSHEPCPDGVDAKKICFVRDPTNWLRSWWGHEQRHGWPSNPNPSATERADSEFIKMMYYLARFKTDSFPEFVMAVETDRPGYVTDFFSRYTHNADCVGRTETLKADLCRFAHIEHPPTLKPYNVTPREFRPRISAEVREFVDMREDVGGLVHA